MFFIGKLLQRFPAFPKSLSHRTLKDAPRRPGGPTLEGMVRGPRVRMLPNATTTLEFRKIEVKELLPADQVA